MELAHRPASVCRTIGKVILLGFLIILLAKAILTFLAVAALGLLVFLGVRLLYIRRASFRQIFLGIRTAIHPILLVVGACAAALLTVAVCTCRCAFSLVLRLGLQTCNLVRQLLTVLAVVLLALCFTSLRIARSLAQGVLSGCVWVGRAAKTSVVKIRSQSAVICGTLLEAASGALVGAVLFNLVSLQGFAVLPDMDQIVARAYAAAVFGAFLGILLGLSRLPWCKQGEAAHLGDNQN